MSGYEPSLGQIAWGNAWGQYAVPDYAEALLYQALQRLDDWDIYCTGDRDVPGLTLRFYWWGDDDAPEATLPNLEFGELRLWFYKYFGRGMSCNVDWSPAEWVEFYRELVAAIEGSEE